MSGTLFDVDRLVPVSCPVCGAVREPGEERAAECRIDVERETDYVRRPSECLNTYDPERTRIPF